MSDRAKQIVLGVAAALASDDPDLASELTSLTERGGESVDSIEARIRRAVEREHVIVFMYEGERRVLSPYYGYSAGGYQLVLGYDHGRAGIRQFRIDRIGNLLSGEGDGLTVQFRHAAYRSRA